MELDKAAFDTLMEEQKTRARKAREALGDLGWAGVEFGKGHARHPVPGL